MMLKDHLQVNIHVDDIHMPVFATTKDEVVELGTNIAFYAQGALHGIGLVLAGEKEAILATEPEIAVSIAKRLGRTVDKPDFEAVKLGVTKAK